MGRAAKLPEARIEQLFNAALLHDIGALSVEEKYSILHETEGEFGDHAGRGEVLLRKLPFLGDAAFLIGGHHACWDDQKCDISENLNLERQILQFADTLERSITRGTYILYQQKDLTERANKKFGTALHSDGVDLFKAVSAREEFWLDMTSRRLYPCC